MPVCLSVIISSLCVSVCLGESGYCFFLNAQLNSVLESGWREVWTMDQVPSPPTHPGQRPTDLGEREGF